MNPYMAAAGWRPPFVPVPVATAAAAAATMAATSFMANRPMLSEMNFHRRMYLTQVSADLRDRAVVWQEYKTPDQKLYYHNEKTGERTWNKPEVIQELEDAIAVIKEEKARKAINEAKNQESSSGKEAQVVTSKSEDKDTSSAAATAATSSPADQQGDGKQKHGMRPVSTTSIPGSPWCIVYTDKNRVFYFNPSTKTSVWDRPAELRNREDVDKMVSNPPTNPNAPTTTTTTTKHDDDESRQSSTSDNNNTTIAQAEKRIKLDANASCSSTTNQSPTTTTAAAAKPAVVPKIVKKEVASEIEKEAAKKRETIAFEERVETFKQLLEEKEVNTNSTFQRELSKIVFDPRYLLLTSNERREVFEKFCSEKNERERKKRHEKMKKATEEFKALLAEANLSSRSTYDEFHSRHSLDPRYLALDRTKDREILFDDHLALLRRKEREERAHSSSSSRRPPPPERRSATRGGGVPLEEAENIYNALLIELITDPELSWHEGKRIMRKSPQWDLTEELPREWKESMFDKHLDKIYARRKEKYLQLLSETKEITLASDWRDVKRIIRDDPRYIKFSSSERRSERVFREFIKKKRALAENDFRQLLRETTLIDGDTRRKIEESEHQHLIDIIGTLQNDKRYLDLEPFSEERRKILLSYIEELAATSSDISAKVKSPAKEDGEDIAKKEEAEEKPQEQPPQMEQEQSSNQEVINTDNNGNSLEPC